MTLDEINDLWCRWLAFMDAQPDIGSACYDEYDDSGFDVPYYLLPDLLLEYEAGVLGSFRITKEITQSTRLRWYLKLNNYLTYPLEKV